jgi:hypothetical protein
MGGPVCAGRSEGVIAEGEGAQIEMRECRGGGAPGGVSKPPPGLTLTRGTRDAWWRNIVYRANTSCARRAARPVCVLIRERVLGVSDVAQCSLFARGARALEDQHPRLLPVAPKVPKTKLQTISPQY